MPDITKTQFDAFLESACVDSGDTVAEFWRAFEEIAKKDGFSAEEIERALERFNE